MRATLLILTAMSISACGANKSGLGGSEDLLSRSGGTLSGKAVAKCNAVTVPAASMEGVLKARFNGVGYDYDRVELKFTRAPAALTSTSTVSMRVLRWGYTGQQLNQNNAYTPMRFLIAAENRVINETSPVTDLSQYTISGVISSYGLGSRGITLANFFSKVHVMIDETDLSYDALTFQFFDSSRGSAPYATGNALIPAFHANPTVYGTQNPSTVLQTLHPMAPNMNSGWTEDHFASYFEQVCKL